MRKGLRVFAIIIVVALMVLTLRFAYYSVIKKVKQTEITLKIDKPSVSGIYPHLAVFNDNHAQERPGETGMGAVVPWGDKLYAITYSAHKPRGSADKLYVIDKDGNMEIHPLSVGGTPANRMIHRESKQLIIGPYFIKENGEVRVITPDKMPGRLTATTRHLEDPANKVYFYTMEEGLYEVDVHSLEVKEIYTDGNNMNPPDIAGPLLPGYHGKGAYISQDRLVVANNGEYRWQTTPESGCLAEWDGNNWKVIERKQFTEVTGPGGLYGNKNQDDPIWSIGWDKKSLILKLRENGEWFTYRLPKASFTYDGQHGWHTEWPRIRDIGTDKWLMTMHGMFWAFPPDFSCSQTTGIRPHSSYLKIIPDFAKWQGMIVMGCDDASSFDNAFVGQPQSNFWFIRPDQLDNFGPRNAYGNSWLNEKADAFEESDPFLVGGFDQLMIVASTGENQIFKLQIERQKPGENNWEVWKTEIFGPFQSIYRTFKLDEETEWIRLAPDTNLDDFSVHLHLSEEGYDRSDLEKFNSLSDIGSDDIRGGWLRPDGNSGDLNIFTSDSSRYFVLDESLNYSSAPIDDEADVLARNLIPNNGSIGADSASVFYIDEEGRKWRIPWGPGEYNEWYANSLYRTIREVATERSLMNAGGIFYELPRDISGGIKKIKAIATHNKMIIDFCSWRGMMVISGTEPSAEPDGHFYGNQDMDAGLWLGTIDDLWSFGKPRGTGGPWHNTNIRAGELSDPYLMLGFDDKELHLSHNASETLTFELLADFTGEGVFKVFEIIQVDPSQKSPSGKAFKFSEGFSANWIKIRADKDCKASASFIYK